MDLEQAKRDLARLAGRIKQCEEAGHSLALYLMEQAAIIERLIEAIREDRASQEPSIAMEAEFEESECAFLLGSLKEELDLVDRNRELASQAAGKTVNVRDLGAAGDGEHDDGPALNEAIRRAAALGPGATVFVPAGRYAVATTERGANGSCHLLISGAEDLAVEAEPGAMLVMGQIAFGIIVENCRNVSVRGLSIDADPLPFTQGPIVAVDPETNSFEMEIDEGSPAPTREYFPAAGILRGTLRFADSGVIDVAGGDPRIKRIEETGPNRYRLTAMRSDGNTDPGQTRGFKVGRTFSLHARGVRGSGPAVAVLASRFVTLEDIAVYASWDHSYLVRGSEGVKLRRCVSEPLPGRRRLGCNVADGFHCPSNRKGPFLENCRIRFTNDDCVNIYSKCHALAKALSPSEYVIDLLAGGELDSGSLGRTDLAALAPQVKTPGPEGKTADGQQTPLYRPGDVIAFVNPNNGAVDRVARVADVGRAEWQGKLRLLLRFDKPLDGLVTRDALGKEPVKGREYLWGRKQGTIEHFVVNLSTKGDGFVIRGCDFAFNRASGLKIKCSNGVYEDNRVERPMGWCLHLLSEMGWMEGWSPRNVILRRNTFIHDRAIMSAYALPFQSESGSRLIRRIRIEDNDFVCAAGPAIRLRSAQDVRITGNRIQSSRPIDIDNCAGVLVEDNVITMQGGELAKPVEVGARADAASIEIRGNRMEGGK